MIFLIRAAAILPIYLTPTVRLLLLLIIFGMGPVSIFFYLRGSLEEKFEKYLTKPLKF